MPIWEGLHRFVLSPSGKSTQNCENGFYLMDMMSTGLRGLLGLNLDGGGAKLSTT